MGLLHFDGSVGYADVTKGKENGARTNVTVDIVRFIDTSR